HTFPSGTVLADQCAIVVFGGGAPTGVFGQALVQTASSGQLGLNNGGDTVTFNNGVSDQAKYRYGGEGGDDQSLTRDPDITGSEPLIKHTTAAGANGALFSPGTRIDGVAFAGCAAPDAAPEVTNTNPAEGAIDVTIDANLTITFSEDVAVSGEWFDIACANSGTRGVADTAVSGGPLTFTIDPNEEFAHGESCTVTIFAAQVSDLDDDDPPDQMTADYAWSFTTAAEADAAPEIIAVDPPDGATAVPLTATLTITFSEPVTVSGGVAIACTVSGEQAAAVSGGPESFTLTPAQPFDHGE
ncbi:Ig-like domain-containing protein, partial [Arthrospira platensis SPKY1]|nr:Ig-like domain-containing protein [Arthrospira platensis SPKY1]